MYMCGCGCISHLQYLWMSEEGMESPGARVIGSHEQSDVC